MMSRIVPLGDFHQILEVDPIDAGFVGLIVAASDAHPDAADRVRCSSIVT